MRLQKALQRGISLIFIVTMVSLAFQGKWERQLLLGSGFLLCYVPWAFEKLCKVTLPDRGETATVLFIFASQYLGSFVRFYELFPWWDAALHFFSGFLMAYWGLILTLPLDRQCLLYKYRKIGILMLIAFLSSAASAALWEMIEFLGDIFLGTDAQLGSLRDTMEDIICGTIGGGLFALYMGVMMAMGRETLVARLYKPNIIGIKIKKRK